jgi:hypothetical protein
MKLVNPLAVVVALAVGSLVGPLSAQPAGATSSTTVSTCNSSSPSSITNNSYIQPGGCLLSPNHEYELVMQTDGNLVLYYMSQSDPLWDSHTGVRGAYATLQATGNLIVNSTVGLSWQSGTAASSSSLVLQDDGNLVVYGTNGAGSPYAAWSTNTQDLRGYELTDGETLEPGQYLKSQNATWTLSMTSSGYLVLSSTISSATPYACPIWSEPAVVDYDPYGGANTPTITTYEPQNLSFSYTDQVPAEQPYLDGYVYSPPSGVTTATPTANAYLNMQGDGNLVLYAPGGGSALWAAGTSSGTGADAELQTDGNVVVYSGSGVALWSSGTNDYRGSTLCTDETLQRGQFLGFSSDQGQPSVTLVMQTTCNLVLYETSPSGAGTAIWASDTDEVQNGTLSKQYAGCYLVMQSDGNLAMYAQGTYPIWQSGTATASPSTSTGHPFVGPFSLNLYNPYLILQRWGTAASWKADPENVVPAVQTVPTLGNGAVGTEVIDGVNKVLTNDAFNLQNALEFFGWL